MLCSQRSSFNADGNRPLEFIADFHIHSRYSRATSRDLTLEALHASALQKGVTVLGTGDFTHPGWMAEIREKLVPAEEGLFRLREDLAREAEERVPPAARSWRTRPTSRLREAATNPGRGAKASPCSRSQSPASRLSLRSSACCG